MTTGSARITDVDAVKALQNYKERRRRKNVLNRFNCFFSELSEVKYQFRKLIL